MSKKFQRCKEDFICQQCGTFVEGTGYTNHCPKCLWSKHVDVNPGDRAATCGGMMEPVSIELKENKYIVLHRCLKCGFERRNKVVSNDNFEKILEIVSNSAMKKSRQSGQV